jgi:hypothetical protein
LTLFWFSFWLVVTFLPILNSPVLSPSQVLLAGDVMQAGKVAELIHGITVGDVQAAAKKLASAKLAMGATGNLSTTPYLDAL